MIIPTHLSTVAALAPLAATCRSELGPPDQRLALTPAFLGGERRVVFMGANAAPAAAAGVAVAATR